jgi:hypothetical protein
MRCPADWYRHYVERRPTPDTPPLAFGRAFARALEALHRGADAELAWVQAYQQWVQPLRAQGQRAPSLQHGLALLALYRRHGVAPGEPEVRFELFLPDRTRVPVPIVGYLDLAGPAEVVEFKTAATRWDQARVDRSWQAAVYRWAFQQTRGYRPTHVRFVVFSTRQVALEEFVTYPSGGDLRLFEQQAAAVWRGLVAGAFPRRCGQCAACRGAEEAG